MVKKIVNKVSLSIFIVLFMGMFGVAVSLADYNDQPDSSAYVGWNWNGYLPAFKDAKGVPIPFRPTSIQPPIGYQGDFYVAEFTDAKIKQAWQDLKVKNPDAAQKIIDKLSVNTDATAAIRYRLTGAFDPKGAVNGNDDLKLTAIRRPAFFGQAPYCEAIAKAEKDAYTVEFTVPRDSYEQQQLKITAPIKLRGWFFKGKGVRDAKGRMTHALVIFTSGNTIQLTAAQHPDAPIYRYNVQTKQYEINSFPNKNLQTEKWTSRQNRQYLYGFYEAGFDVLSVDKRGHGISGGVNGLNAGEMAEDNFRMLEQLESGNGLAVVTPDGKLLQGKECAGLLLRNIPAKNVPLIVGGTSLGSMVTAYTMQKNILGWTAFNEPDQKFTPAKKYNIKAALLLADFAGGVGYVSNPDLGAVYQEAAYRVEKNMMVFPTSEILANIAKWPAVFFGKGLWDESACSVEGTFETYRRVKGLKELVFVRGPHSEGQWGKENINYMVKKLTEFAVRVINNPTLKYPEIKSFKEAVVNSAPYWEPSSRP